MLHDNMNISRLMVYTRRVEDARVKRKSRDAKRERSFDGGSSKNSLEIRDNLKFKRCVFNQVGYKFRIASGYKVSNPKFNKVKGTNSPYNKTTCGKCCKKHYGDCLKGTKNCFGCSKSGHRLGTALM